MKARSNAKPERNEMAPSQRLRELLSSVKKAFWHHSRRELSEPSTDFLICVYIYMALTYDLRSISTNLFC
jgi:hypothetical protein